MDELVSSCQECKTKCCSVGPGPHKKVSPEVYLGNWGEYESYNTKCEAFVDGKCANWGTDKLPLECRVYVCTSRKFSEAELETIAHLTGR